MPLRQKPSDMTAPELKVLTDSLGLGLSDIARLFDVSRRYVTMWRGGKRPVPARVEVTLLTMRECTPAERLEFYRRAFGLGTSRRGSARADDGQRAHT